MYLTLLKNGPNKFSRITSIFIISTTTGINFSLQTLFERLPLWRICHRAVVIKSCCDSFCKSVALGKASRCHTNAQLVGVGRVLRNISTPFIGLHCQLDSKLCWNNQRTYSELILTILNFDASSNKCTGYATNLFIAQKCKWEFPKKIFSPP